MTMRAFIRANRAEITARTGAANDRERELWVLNDEGLYRWARRCGVPV